MALYSDSGVVLRTYKLSEADKIVVVFAKNRGKIRAVAKGVRRTKSKFGSKLEPGSIISFQCYEGKSLDTFTQVERIALLNNLRSDLDLFTKESVLLESIDKCCEDGESNPGLLKLLIGAMVELDNTKNTVIVSAFLAKLLMLEGLGPIVDCCAVCERKDPLVAFSLTEGGALCIEHRKGMKVSQELLLALQNIFRGNVRHVLDTTGDGLARELEAVTTMMIEEHISRKLNSSSMSHSTT